MVKIQKNRAVSFDSDVPFKISQIVILTDSENESLGASY